MKAIYAILFIISLFLISCTKDSGPTTVEGRVLEVGSNKAIPFAEVFLVNEKSEILSSGSGVGIVQTTKADANGKYSFQFEAEKEYTYGVNAKAENYLETSDYGLVQRGRKNKNDILLNGYGYLKYHIKNVKNKYSIGFNTNCFRGDEFYENIDTTIICKEIGNLYYPFRYRLTSISDTVAHGKEIFIPNRDTAFLNIEY